MKRIRLTCEQLTSSAAIVLVGLILSFVIGFFSGKAHASELSIPEMTLVAEAGGEGIEGMTAVANVIRNRAKYRGKTFDEVCLAKWQFSCWNGGRENVEKFVNRNKSVWDDARTAWQLSKAKDITGGADLYHADYVRPKWDFSKTICLTKYDRHIFYKEIK